ncbi:hypothetical protein CKO15_11365 [Halorhodospira abdelmalekii]|uniref:AAA family ATPase n=1 Tax=Halorhodospira abdelmalekii TaxID=421629 RepID=UPI0019035163|nr:ATP-binding protein [Halorhodospira abdelmalekii]MBK1735865.1 hypothetical protein [Halorhodospira abdelmalekii]
MPHFRRRFRHRGSFTLDPTENNGHVDPISELLRLWLIRLLVHTRCVEALVNHCNSVDEDLVAALGLTREYKKLEHYFEQREIAQQEFHPHRHHHRRRGMLMEEGTATSAEIAEADGSSEVDQEFDTYREWIAAIYKILEERLATLEQSELILAENNRLVRNAQAVCERLQLGEIDAQLLVYVTLEQMEDNLVTQVFGAARVVQRCDYLTVLAVALDLPEPKIREALRPGAPLIRAGLIQHERHRMMRNGSGLELLDGLAEALIGELESTDDVFHSYFRPSPGPQLAQSCFAHLAKDLEQLVRLLRNAASAREHGINILLYGPPGTGKTELARLAAQQAGLDTREVNYEMADGKPLNPHNRQRAYQLCQHLMGRSSESAILFDEIEDVFGGFNILRMLFSSRGEDRGGKAWTNHMLETNPAPAIWITNSSRVLDPSYLRRFAYTLEVRPPSPAVRAGMLREACAELPVSEGWIARAAQIDGLTPAEIQSAVRTARLIGDHHSASNAEAFLEQHLRRQCRLQGRRPPQRRRGSELLRYDMEYLNAKPEIDTAVNALVNLGSGSLLLHGLPGTGKTALAEHIAHRAGRELISRPASQLLSKWVGGTEQNLAALFEQAQDEEAVLLIDEADSLLSSREGARASWEVTQTNELLVQIESFEGILICATNFLEALDSAVLRRFDHKVKLLPLRPPQREALFIQLCEVLEVDQGGDQRTGPGQCAGRRGASAIAPALARRLQQLDSLTPGDFATVARRFAHSTRADGTAQGATSGPALDGYILIEALEVEQQIKPEGRKRSVGFAL